MSYLILITCFLFMFEQSNKGNILSDLPVNINTVFFKVTENAISSNPIHTQFLYAQVNQNFSFNSQLLVVKFKLVVRKVASHTYSYADPSHVPLHVQYIMYIAVQHQCATCMERRINIYSNIYTYLQIFGPRYKSFIPKSDIHCNRSATSLRPKFKTIAQVAEESQLGFAVGRRLVGD